MTADLQVLDQACRNTRGKAWFPRPVDDMKLFLFAPARSGLGVQTIRDEYNRLLRLKKEKAA